MDDDAKTQWLTEAGMGGTIGGVVGLVAGAYLGSRSQAHPWAWGIVGALVGNGLGALAGYSIVGLAVAPRVSTSTPSAVTGGGT